MSKTFYRLTKRYRNGRDIYFIEAHEAPSEDLLEEIGDATNGGHNYGFYIEAEEVVLIPYGYFLNDRLQNIVDKYERLYEII